MFTWCVSAVILLSVQTSSKLLVVPQPGATGDATAQLKERCVKVATERSYSFESTTETEGGGFGGGRGGPPGGGAGGGAGGPPAGGAAGAPPGGGAPGGPRVESTTGKVEIGKVAELKRGDTMAYRMGEKLTYQKEGAWEIYTAPDFGAGGGGGRGAGGGAAGGGAAGGGAGGAGGAGGGAGTGGRGGPGGGRGAFTMMSLANMTLPHELLKDFETRVKEVKSAEADGKTTFTATLNDAAADEFSGAKRMKEMAERFGGGQGGEITSSGTATIVFGKDGHLERIVLETKTTSQMGDSKSKKTTTFKDWSATKFEVPKDAAVKLTG